MLKISSLVCALGITLATDAQLAVADGWPSSVVGNWSVLGNQSPGTLSISTQVASGQCQLIAGTIYGDPIQGFYCPNSGRIQFVRKKASDNDTTQVWTGNLSQAAATLHIGGTFTSIDPAFGGSLGEYSFSANK